MPRKARVEFLSTVYHLIGRGDRQEPLVRDDGDRKRFVATVGQVCERTSWRIYAWVLMTNITTC